MWKSPKDAEKWPKSLTDTHAFIHDWVNGKCMLVQALFFLNWTTSASRSLSNSTITKMKWYSKHVFWIYFKIKKLPTNIYVNICSTAIFFFYMVLLSANLTPNQTTIYLMKMHNINPVYVGYPPTLTTSTFPCQSEDLVFFSLTMITEQRQK